MQFLIKEIRVLPLKLIFSYQHAFLARNFQIGTLINFNVFEQLRKFCCKNHPVGALANQATWRVHCQETASFSFKSVNATVIKDEIASLKQTKQLYLTIYQLKF